MTLYVRKSDGGMMIRIRTEHSMDLRSLVLALYHSNETLGDELSIRAVRTAVSDVFAHYGDEVVVRASDYIREALEFDDSSAVGGDTVARLEWARRMVVKAYGPQFEQFSASRAALRAFEALPAEEIV